MRRPARLLLDTHVFIWWRANSPLLGREARAAIASADLVFVSVASAWEAAIKIALGKLRLPESFEAGVECEPVRALADRPFRMPRPSHRCLSTIVTRSTACSSCSA